MISKLEAAMPPFDGVDIAAAKINFESAVARLEAEVVLRNIIAPSTCEAPPSSSDREGGDMRTERGAASSGARTRETWLTDLLERASNGAGDGERFAPERDRGCDV
jgi:hypothetical protein